MPRLCKNCEYFNILYEPMKDVDFGKAECKKHNLITDFLDHKKFGWLSCIEDGKMKKKKKTEKETIINGLYDIKNWKCNGDARMHEVISKAIEELEQQEADGCNGCAFADTEEWEMPCQKCRRACKDYWRAAKNG